MINKNQEWLLGEKRECYNEKTVSLNTAQEKISSNYNQVLLIKKKFPSPKEIDLFKLNKNCLNQQNFL